MRRVNVTPASKIAHRIAVMACVAILGVGATACGASDNNVTPQAPAVTTPKPTATTVATPPTTSPQGGAGF